MAQVGEVSVPMSKVMRGITLALKITGVRRARLRIAVGIRLLMLAAWIMGVTVEVSTDLTPPPKV